MAALAGTRSREFRAFTKRAKMRENLEIVFDKNGILAGFTNRLGGVSEGEFSSLNLGDHVGDNLADVIKNREILAQNLGVKKLKFMKQIHSDKVFVLENGKISRSGSASEIFLKSAGSQKFAFNAKVLEIKKCDAIFVASVLINRQICEVVLSSAEASGLRAGDTAIVSTKAFGVNLVKA